MFGWDDAIGATLKIIDKVIPDADKKAQMQLDIIKAQQAGELDEVKVALGDVASARAREMTVKDRTPAVLAALAVGGFLALIGVVVFGYQPAAAMRDLFMILVGAAITTYKDVYGYYFGSSSGSRAKDATIKQLSGE